MSSVPSFRMPEIENPFNPQNALQMATAPMQFERTRQQNQADALDLQEKQQDMKDLQGLRKAYLEADGNLEKTRSLAVKYGVSPKLLMTLDAQIAEAKTKYFTMNKAKREDFLSQADQVRGLIPPVQKADDGTPEGAIRAAELYRRAMVGVQQLQKQGLLSQELVDGIPTDYPGRDGMAVLSAGLTTGTNWIKEANEAETRATAAKTTEATTSRAATAADTARRQREKEEFGSRVSRLAVAAEVSEAEFNRVLGTYKPELREPFLNLGPYDQKRTPGLVRHLGMTAEQQTQAEQTAATRTATEENQRILREQGAARVEQGWDRIKQGGQNSATIEAVKLLALQQAEREYLATKDKDDDAEALSKLNKKKRDIQADYEMAIIKNGGIVGGAPQPLPLAPAVTPTPTPFPAAPIVTPTPTPIPLAQPPATQTMAGTAQNKEGDILTNPQTLERVQLVKDPTTGRLKWVLLPKR